MPFSYLSEHPNSADRGQKSPLKAAECASDHGKAECAKLGGECVLQQDGYYTVSFLCVALGVLILVGWIRPTVRKLQGESSFAFELSSAANLSLTLLGFLYSFARQRLEGHHSRVKGASAAKTFPCHPHPHTLEPTLHVDSPRFPFEMMSSRLLLKVGKYHSVHEISSVVKRKRLLSEPNSSPLPSSLTPSSPSQTGSRSDLRLPSQRGRASRRLLQAAPSPSSSSSGRETDEPVATRRPDKTLLPHSRSRCPCRRAVLSLSFCPSSCESRPRRRACRPNVCRPSVVPVASRRRRLPRRQTR